MSQILPPPPATLPTRLTPLGRLGPMVGIEYLESTGTQWIDTGIVPSTTNGNVLSIKASYTGGNQVGCLFGVCQQVGSTGYFFQLNKTSTNEQFRLITSNGDKFYTKSSSFYSETHLYEMRANVLYIDGVNTLTGNGTFGSFTENMFLFARNDKINGMEIGAQKGKWRIYSVEMTRGGATLLDMVPVRIETTGYLYDKVTGSLFGNSGTGEFILGPDKIS